MTHPEQRLTRGLTIRYAAVLSALGVLAVGSFLGLMRILMAAENDSAAAADMGHQSALLAKTVYLAGDLALMDRGSPSAHKIDQDLAKVLDRFESVHNGLIEGFPERKSAGALPDAVRTMLFAPKDDVDQRSRRFLGAARGLVASRIGDPGFNTDLVRVKNIAASDLSDLLDQIAQAYLDRNRARLKELFGFHAFTLAATLLLLLMSAGAVFRPMVERINRDMKKRVAVEKTLRESEERLWRLLQESPVGVSASRREDGVVVFANARFCEILGGSPEDVIGKQARDLYADNNQLRSIVHRLKTHGELNDVEVEFRRFDGRPFLSLLTVRGAVVHGNHVNLAWIYDISSMREAEQQLRLNAKVVDSASEAVVITSADNIIEYVNPAFTDITGYSFEDVIGQKPSLWRSGRHSAEFFQDMWRSVNEEGRWKGEIWNRRKTGEFYAEWLSIVAIKDESGKVSHYIAIFSDITHKKEDEERVWRQANFDALTGLPNRALFVDRLSQAVRQSQREHKRFALMFIDLDGFKKVNDTLGHAAGDVLLQQAGIRLTECVRATDTVSRLAGDEFTCIVQSIHNREDAALVADKILSRLADAFNLDGREGGVRGSIGISIYPDDTEDEAQLVKMADQAMYAVKRSGKNNYRFYQDESGQEFGA